MWLTRLVTHVEAQGLSSVQGPLAWDSGSLADSYMLVTLPGMFLVPLATGDTIKLKTTDSIERTVKLAVSWNQLLVNVPRSLST